MSFLATHSTGKIGKCVPVNRRLNCRPAPPAKGSVHASLNFPGWKPICLMEAAREVHYYLCSCQLIAAIVAEKSALLLLACTTQVQVAVDCHCWWRPYLNKNVCFAFCPHSGQRLKERRKKFDTCRLLLRKFVGWIMLCGSFQSERCFAADAGGRVRLARIPKCRPGSPFVHSSMLTLRRGLGAALFISRSIAQHAANLRARSVCVALSWFAFSFFFFRCIA